MDATAHVPSLRWFALLLVGVIALAIHGNSPRDHAVPVAPVVSAAPARAAMKFPVFAFDAYVDGRTVYWTSARGDAAGTVTLWRWPFGADHVEELARSAGFGFAIADGMLFYADDRGNAIHRLDLADRRDRVIAHGSGQPATVVAAGGYVYWTVMGERGVLRASYDGTGVTRLPIGRDRDAIAADSEALYVADSAGGTIARVAHGRDAPTAIATGVGAAPDLAVAGGFAYYTSGRDVFRVALHGGASDRVATGGIAHRLAASGSALYWTTWGDDRATAQDGCAAFDVGTLRRLADREAPEVIAASCTIRGVAVGSAGRFLMETDRLAQF